MRNETCLLWLYVLDMNILNEPKQSKAKQNKTKTLKKPLSELARTDYILKLKFSCKPNLTALRTSIRRLSDSWKNKIGINLGWASQMARQQLIKIVKWLEINILWCHTGKCSRTCSKNLFLNLLIFAFK